MMDDNQDLPFMDITNGIAFEVYKSVPFDTCRVFFFNMPAGNTERDWIVWDGRLDSCRRSGIDFRFFVYAAPERDDFKLGGNTKDLVAVAMWGMVNHRERVMDFKRNLSIEFKNQRPMCEYEVSLTPGRPGTVRATISRVQVYDA